MAWKYNPFTKKIDYSLGSTKYLKIDQTTPQTVINGRPIFNGGARSNDDIILRSGRKLVFDGA
jgi:hypothetical protein